MTPIALVIILTLGIGILFLSRNYAPLFMFIGVLYIPLGSVIVVGPADFTAVRILVVFAFIRIVSKQEYQLKFNKVDATILLWVCANILTGILLNRRDTTIFLRLGQSYDVIGSYFSFRFWLRTKDELVQFLNMAGVALLPMAFEMIYEQQKGMNLFYYLGGRFAPVVRDGQIRSNAAFAHAILAGTIGATSLGFYVPLLRMKDKKIKRVALAGMAASMIIAYTSSSSGPIMSLGFIIAGHLFWSLRFRMKAVVKAGIMALLGLEIIMESHVWYLIGRIDLTGSSTGWHRAELINSALVHINEWWLLGTDYTRHWMATGVSWSRLHTDITNHYILNGVNGGLVTMLLFIGLIRGAFSFVGKIVNAVWHCDRELEFLAWSLGVILFSHTVTFISVAYFDQTIYAFYFLLAMISSLYQYVSASYHHQALGNR